MYLYCNAERTAGKILFRDCKDLGEVPDLEFELLLWRKEDLEQLFNLMDATFGEEFCYGTETTKRVRRALQLDQ